MAKQDIIDKVKEILDSNFEITKVSYVPDISDPKLTFGNKGLSFPATVLYIDMRGSTAILNKHHKYTVAKIHMAYFHTIIKIIKPYNGKIRSFNGDSVLVFFYDYSVDIISRAVSVAMQIKFMLSSDDGIADYLKKYSPIDFGIGIDHGEILCTKIGEPRITNNQDLIWIGNPVNKATAISDKCSKPNHIGISFATYQNLRDGLKYYSANPGTYNAQKKSCWTEHNFTYNNDYCLYYSTHCQIASQ